MRARIWASARACGKKVVEEDDLIGVEVRR